MKIMKHDKQLIEDEDYIVVEEKPAYRRSESEDSIRRSQSAIGIYFPTVSSETIYLCRTCRQFTSVSVQGIHAHQQTHRNVERKTAAANDQTVLRSVAFGLLPVKIQAQLLTQARAIVGGA